MANDLKKRIMRRIYAIWFVRRALPIGLGSAVSMFAALRVTADSFFVAKIAESFKLVLANNIWGLPKYVEASLNHVEPYVLVLIAAGGLISFTLAVKLFRSIRDIAFAGTAVAAEARKF